MGLSIKTKAKAKAKTKAKVNEYTRIQKGIFMYNRKDGNLRKTTYRVRKNVLGVAIQRTFTNKAKAIKFYNSL